jgi:hypothetical protein
MRSHLFSGPGHHARGLIYCDVVGNIRQGVAVVRAVSFWREIERFYDLTVIGINCLAGLHTTTKTATSIVTMRVMTMLLTPVKSQLRYYDFGNFRSSRSRITTGPDLF